MVFTEGFEVQVNHINLHRMKAKSAITERTISSDGIVMVMDGYIQGGFMDCKRTPLIIIISLIIRDLSKYKNALTT